MTKLEKGLIPPYTECPFMNKCPEWKNGDCAHLGVQHTSYFSCGLARLIDIMDKDDHEKT